MVEGWRYEGNRKQTVKAYPRKGDARQVGDSGEKEMYVCTVRIGHEQPFTVTGFFNTKYRSLDIPDLDLVAKRGYFGPKKSTYRRRY